MNIINFEFKSYGPISLNFLLLYYRLFHAKHLKKMLYVICITINNLYKIDDGLIITKNNFDILWFLKNKNKNLTEC